MCFVLNKEIIKENYALFLHVILYIYNLIFTEPNAIFGLKHVYYVKLY